MNFKIKNLNKHKIKSINYKLVIHKIGLLVIVQNANILLKNLEISIAKKFPF